MIAIRAHLCRAAAFLLILATAGCAGDSNTPFEPLPGCGPGDEGCFEAVAAEVNDMMAENDLSAVILKVTRGGREVLTLARGEALPGVPVTADHRFRNGAVAISYLSTLLLRYAEQDRVDLDATIDTWLPELPNADAVTLRMLANSTSGYPDYVPDDDFVDALYEDPFHEFTPDELMGFAFATPPWYEPGTNWSYAHTNFLVLGLALEQIGGQPLAELLRAEVLDPLGLDETRSRSTPEIDDPALHHFTSERGFLEDATFWTPSWQLPPGALMTTTIGDMVDSARGIGRGALLSEAMYEEMVDPTTVGLGGPDETCPPGVCIDFNADRYFAMGVAVAGNWVMQTPTFLGFSGVQAYLPEEDLAIAVVATGPQGPNYAVSILVQAAQILVPGQAPPM